MAKVGSAGRDNDGQARSRVAAPTPRELTVPDQPTYQFASVIRKSGRRCDGCGKLLPPGEPIVIVIYPNSSLHNRVLHASECARASGTAPDMGA